VSRGQGYPWSIEYQAAAQTWVNELSYRFDFEYDPTKPMYDELHAEYLGGYRES
jgi:hypothetical protein